MSGDRTGETSVSATLSAATAAWLEEVAADLGVRREELLRSVVAAARAADEGDGAPATRDDLAALRETVASLDDELDEKIDDVRQRVIQVKREADGKAPADHDHPDLAERVDDAAAEAEALAAEVAALRETVGDLRTDADGLDATVSELSANVERGFGNYEEVLEYLTDERDRLAADLDALADAVESVQGSVRSLADRVTTVAGVEHLREEANRHGVRTAACQDCGGEVDVALLTRPACPHCNATFSDVEPRRGFLGSHTLVVGEVPALRAGTGPAADLASTDGGDGPESTSDRSPDAGDTLNPFGDDD